MDAFFDDFDDFFLMIFLHMVLPTVNLWGNQLVRFTYVVRIGELCHIMYILEYKYTEFL